MSSILKALKKLEQEKALHEESAGVNVSREILMQESGSRTMLKWLWLLGISAAVIIMALTVALLQKPAPNEAVTPGRPPVALQSDPASVAAPPSPVAPGATGSGTAATPAPPVSADPVRQPEVSIPTPAPAQQPLKGQIPLPPLTPTGDPSKPDPVVTPAKTQPPAAGEPKLTLSGIAWNKDSADRLAIINGQPTATGATVNGIRVEEIMQDRVRLYHNGRTFEIFIGRDARTD